MNTHHLPWLRAGACWLIVFAACGMLPRTPANPPPFVHGEAAFLAGLDPNTGGKGDFEFRFERRPWGEVFEWLADRTGMPFIASCQPTGSFTFTGDKGKRYTLPEIIRILDRTLQQQGWRLILGRCTFTLIPEKDLP